MPLVRTRSRLDVPTSKAVGIATLEQSLMPASEFAQKQVGVVAGFADVVKDGRAAQLAGVVDDEIAKAQQSLGNAGRNGDVLNLAERNVSRGTCYQTGIHFQLRIG